MSRKSQKQPDKINKPVENKSDKEVVNGIISDTDPWWKKRNAQLILSGVLLFILVLITYKDSVKNNFVDWDDYAYVVNNELVRNPGDSFLKELFTTQVSSNYHPLTILSLWANKNECKSCPDGISAVPYIRWNVILHILNTLLVLILIYNLSNKNILVSFLSAALFGVHPMHVESVAWIAERKDVLYSFFFLSGLIAYLNYKRLKRYNDLWLVVSFLLFILSCLSKAMAVVFPVVLILINFWVYNTEEEKPALKALKDAVSWKNLLLLAPFFIVSIFVGLMAFRVQSGKNFLGLLDLTKNIPDIVNKAGPFSVFQRLEIASYGFITYIIKFFVPVNLNALHPYPSVQELSHGTLPVIMILTMLATILIAFFVIRSLAKTKLYAFGFGFYFITVALVLQFITVGMAIMAERYSYLPYIGLSMIAATLVANASKTKRNVLLFFSGCFIIMLMVLSGRQVDVWRNSETLWTKVIDKHPHLEVPRKSRGKYYSKRSFLAKTDTEKRILEDKALVDFTEAIKAGTRSSDVFQGAGIIYGSKGDLKNAITFLDKAVSLDPKKGSNYYNRALIYDKLNKKESAISDYNLALIYKPQMAKEILNNRSNLLLETSRFKDAILDLDYLISVESNNFLYYSNRGYAKFRMNDVRGAIIDYQTALKIKPDDQFSRDQLQTIIKNQK